MLDLVTIDEATAHIRTDSDEDLVWLATWIPIVSEAVAGWLKESWRLYVPELDPDGNPVLDSSGNPIPFEDSSGFTVRPVVRGAVLLELASMYRFREGGGTENVVPDAAGYGYTLNKASTALLAALRKSTVR